MKCDITCFYNTGFNTVNIPDNPSLLSSYITKTFSSVFVKQDRDLIKLKIASTWNDIKNADYLKMHTDDEDNYYFIINIVMINDNLASLDLMEDVINSIGGFRNIEIIDGWATRLSVGDDTLYSNTIDEDFQPSQNLIIDDVIEIGKNTTDEKINLVGATVQIDDDNLIADNYVTEDTLENVVVPRTPPVAGKTIFRIDYEDTQLLQNEMPNQRFYNFDNDDVKNNIVKIRSLGLESSISSCYSIPKNYISNSILDTDISLLQLVSDIKVDDNTIPKIFGTYEAKNNKVYSTYNTITLKSIASQNSVEYRPYEITIPTGNNIDFIYFADLSPDGKPFARPITYLGKTFLNISDKLELFLTGIDGSSWQNTPFTLTNIQNEQYLNYSAAVNRQTSNINYQDFLQKNIGFSNSIRRTLSDVSGISNITSNLSGGLSNMSGSKQIMSTPGQQNAFNQMQQGSGIIGTMSYGGVNMMNSFNNIGDNIDTNTLMRSQIMQEKYQYEYAKNVVIPTTMFPRANSIQNYIGNSFIAYRTRLTDEDMERLDNYYTKFGYKTSEKLTINKLFTRTNFNFVEANGVFVGSSNSNVTKRRRNAIETLFANGFRIWHTKPSSTKLLDNPII